MKYVLSFVFSHDLKRVVLLKKNRPARLVGRWNAPGGKIEEFETSGKAAAREFEEECGLKLSTEDFLQVGIMNSQKNDFEIYVNTAVADISKVIQTTDEIICIFGVDNVYRLAFDSPGSFDNDMLYWLQLARLAHQNGHQRFTTVKFL